MEEETKREIEETVTDILKNANMDEMTESKVRKLASDKLGIDLSGKEEKKLVRNVVESFISSLENQQKSPPPPQKQQQQEEPLNHKDDDDEEAEVEEEDAEEEEKTGSGDKEYDDNGDLIICRLSNRRRVTLQDFRGKTLVSIREYYEKDGKELPSSKGISLTAEQWSSFSKAVPGIEEAIKKMETR